MQDKVYSAFASWEQKRRYICKSEINRVVLRNMGVPDCVTIQEAKSAFDSLLRKDIYIVVTTGSSRDKNKRRHTQYVTRFALYREIIKGR